MPFKERIRYLIGTHRILYYTIFKIILPFCMSVIQLDYLCGHLSNFFLSKGAHIYDRALTTIIFVSFFTFLFLLPKIASFLEFIFHPLFIVTLILLGPNNELLAIIAVVFSILLLIAKIFFYFAFIVDDAIHDNHNDDGVYY